MRRTIPSPSPTYDMDLSPSRGEYVFALLSSLSTCAVFITSYIFAQEVLLDSVCIRNVMDGLC